MQPSLNYYSQLNKFYRFYGKVLVNGELKPIIDKRKRKKKKKKKVFMTVSLLKKKITKTLSNNVVSHLRKALE